ncbi:MAG TPA: pitrilysin family protein [Pyrinomonadaceae bacterium]|nr:pitrilysin family protein [Pyrinomonadaceae bacterium]
MKENIQTTTLENGLTILTETMPDARSASIVFWFNKGSRHEPGELNGISHFIEHAVFKGTKKRSALDIAVEIDRLGGNFDAFTSHETTGFGMKVVDKQLPQAFDLLADMLANPVFDEKELKRERRVIVEEMKMVEDTPEEFLGEIFQADFFPNHVLGLPIEGTRQSVRRFNRNVTSEYHAQTFQPENLVIAAAGNIEHAQIENLVGRIFKVQSSKFKVQSLNHETLNLEPVTLNSPSIAAPIILKKKRELEQAHLIIAAPWIEAKSEKRYAAHLLESIFGSGTSSRLWQSIREKRGLAYSVGASGMSFEDCGIFSIFAATSPEKLDETIDLSIAELAKIKKHGVSGKELQLAKDQANASILLGLEDSGVRAGNLAQQAITYGKTIALEETLEKIEAVRADDIQQLAEEFFQTEKIALAALGNLNGLKVERERLNVD